MSVKIVISFDKNRNNENLTWLLFEDKLFCKYFNYPNKDKI